MRSLSFDAGATTSAWRARMALRMRARKSAMGSVIDMQHLPARLDDTGDVSPERQVSEADPAQIKLPQERPRAAALLAAVAMANAPFRGRAMKVDGFCHDLGPERHSEVAQKSAPLLVGASAGGEGDVHTLGLFQAFVVDLRKDDLLANTQRVIAASVERLR